MNSQDWNGQAKEIYKEVKFAENKFQSKWQHEWHPIVQGISQAYKSGVEDSAKVAHSMIEGYSFDKNGERIFDADVVAKAIRQLNEEK